MKKVILILSFVVITTCLYAQKNRKKVEIDPIVKEQIDSKRYKISVTTALPNGSRSVSLDGRYSLEIKGDSVVSYLPYFGRAYSLPYGGGEGLIFDSTISDYTVKEGKKGAIVIKFSTRTKEDYYTYTVEVFSNGSSSIRVNSNNKQGIDFFGNFLRGEFRKTQ